MSIDTSILGNIGIVLMQPKFPENIGAAARSAFNMGISRLTIVRDELPDRESMTKMATHKARHLIDNMEIHMNLEDALADFNYVIGTTARRGRQRGKNHNPRQVISKIADIVPNNKVAFLFGPEDSGLTNEELKYCHMTSSIPTADFSSLNLAQAVAIHCYEIYHGLIHDHKDTEPSPQYASTFELEGMYSHVEKALIQVNFLQEKNHTYWMNNIRQFLGKIRLSSKDSNIIRGICRQFIWYQGHTKEHNNNTG
jgi:tRNA/rRNA methyltransferase